MKGAVIEVAAAFVVAACVTTRFHDINFTRARPFAIDRVLRHHPWPFISKPHLPTRKNKKLTDSRPDPISLRQLRHNLHPSILDTLVPFSRQPRTPDGRDHIALIRVTGDAARTVFVARAAVILGEVERVVAVQLIVGDGRGFVGESGDDVQTLVVDVCVALIGGGPVKRAGSVAVELDFVRPNVRVEGLEIVLVNETVLQGCELVSDLSIHMPTPGFQTNQIRV